MPISFDKKTHSSSLEGLEQLGFTEKEARVYIALLSLGEVGASKVMTTTGLHGQFVYDALKGLENKGFVQYSIMRGRKKFSAKRPDTLVSFVDQKKRIAENVAESLERFTNTDLRQFEIFQGQDSFVANEFKTIEEAAPDSDILVIGGTGDQYYRTHGKYFEAYEYNRIKKNIAVRYIGCEPQREFFRRSEADRKLFTFRLLPGLFAGEENTAIYEDKIHLCIFGEPVVTFVIANRKIADSYRQFFETLWKLGK